MYLCHHMKDDLEALKNMLVILLVTYKYLFQMLGKATSLKQRIEITTLLVKGRPATLQLNIRQAGGSYNKIYTHHSKQNSPVNFANRIPSFSKILF